MPVIKIRMEYCDQSVCGLSARYLWNHMSNLYQFLLRPPPHTTRHTIMCPVVCVFVCLSVCPRAYLSGTARPDFAKFSVIVACCRGSVVIWRRSDMLCTSGFVDDVILSIQLVLWAIWTPLQRRRRSVVRRSTPLLLCAGHVLS